MLKKNTRRNAPASGRAGRGLRATAYHEAFHAVAFWDRDVRFKYVSIVPNEEQGFLGIVQQGFPKWFDPEDASTPRHRLHSVKVIVASFAGETAERRFRRQRIRYRFDRPTYICGTPSTTNAFLHYAYFQARDLVTARWPAVVAVAKELIAKKRLRHSEVVDVIRRARSNGEHPTRCAGF